MKSSHFSKDIQECLINKEALERPKDLEDLKYLKKAMEKKGGR